MIKISFGVGFHSRFFKEGWTLKLSAVSVQPSSTNFGSTDSGEFHEASYPAVPGTNLGSLENCLKSIFERLVMREVFLSQ